MVSRNTWGKIKGTLPYLTQVSKVSDGNLRVSYFNNCWWPLKLSWITCQSQLLQGEGSTIAAEKKKTSKWHGIGIEIGDTQFQAIKLTLEPSRSACSAPACGLCQKCQNSVRKSAQNLSIANLVSILMVSFSNPVLHSYPLPRNHWI